MLATGIPPCACDVLKHYGIGVTTTPRMVEDVEVDVD